ncbi:hypothetical protein NDU88_003578 [Pleurodeles waltl]|uniref:Uncharacterized protein n=1 Tax=Pleurodeles waltl TaxID=8319 RepID=A0AAV7N0J2_PLEWA|nr:hypothetical protein NDU88_003578 [Pleurodeles waltl]
MGTSRGTTKRARGSNWSQSRMTKRARGSNWSQSRLFTANIFSNTQAPDVRTTCRGPAYATSLLDRGWNFERLSRSFLDLLHYWCDSALQTPLAWLLQ